MIMKIKDEGREEVEITTIDPTISSFSIPFSSFPNINFAQISSFVIEFYSLEQIHPLFIRYICGDGTCDTLDGETSITCYADCHCGDGICDDIVFGESNINCYVDCHCGDGVCDTTPPALETWNNCFSDCYYCGDGICSGSETLGNCEDDCHFCGDGICSISYESIGTCPVDCYCGDGICDTFESSITCFSDCNACGDGICDGYESISTCPADCHCGDGICDTVDGETVVTCPVDCYCGDGICDTDEASETLGTCCQDCGGYCGDGYCHTDCGETIGSCSDCGSCSCGDLQCQPGCGETVGTCCQDCGGCGDGICCLGESVLTCCIDCSDCGDGICQAVCGETVGTCCQDCADFMSDPSNCGTCGNQCGINEICQTGTCVCGDGTADCGAGCVDIYFDPYNCNSCGTSCGVNADCLYGFCDCTYYYNDCDSDIGCESAIMTDPNNCGYCDNVCPPGFICNSGNCECPLGTTSCGGICVDIITDSNNCGGCFDVCSSNQGVFICNNGECIVSSCTAGYEDCNLNPTDGCETPLDTTSDCAACGLVCFHANGVSECSSGTCTLSSCYAVWGNCDSIPFNGCETPLNSLTNCGVCGTTCGYPNAITDCSSGACVFQSCASPFLDCNANLGLDGCEVNGNSDNNHCGNCATVCVGAEQCVSGSCIIPTCTGGTADCDANGSCETDINNDVNNCGGCGHVCSSNHGTASCSGGVCSIVCNAAFDNCNADISDGCETDLHTISNCGVCGTACSLYNALSLCASGTCIISSCFDGWADCDGNPTNGCETPLNTNSNCEACGTTCSPAHSISDCSTGTCLLASCNGIWGDCDANSPNGCESPLNTNSNCGGCGLACSHVNGVSDCSSGICQLALCNGGFGNCDGDPLTGCETPLNTNSNCGGCGDICTLPDTCNSGFCSLCLEGTADCNANIFDGCETSLLTTSNCGSCGNVCSLPHATSTCIQVPYNYYYYYYYYSNIECAILDCDQGYFDCNLNDADGCESFAKCITSCPEGTIDCDSNGSCETNIYTDVNNCGFCNNICSSNHATPLCTKGECTPVCNQPFADCNANRNLLSGLVVDNFMEGSQVITLIMSPGGPISNSNFYTSPQGATSPNIVGGERDLQLTATVTTSGRVYSTGISAGSWDISTPTIGGGICKLQYDSIDNSMNLYQNGLGNIKGFPGGFDITQNGKGIGFRFTYTTDFTVMLSMKVYSPTGKPSVVDIQLTPTSGYDEIRAPFANFVGECDFTSVGAIELIATLEFGSIDISIKELTIYLDPNSSMNDGCESDLSTLLNCATCGNVCSTSNAICLETVCDVTLGCITADRTCDDANDCTMDACDTNVGCIHTNQCIRVDRLNIDTFDDGYTMNVIVDSPLPITESSYYISSEGGLDTGLLGGERDCSLTITSGNSADLFQITISSAGVFQFTSNSRTGSAQAMLQYDGFDHSMNNHYDLTANDITNKGISDAFHLDILNTGSCSITINIYSSENEKSSITIALSSSKTDYYIFYNQLIGNCNLQAVKSIEMIIKLTGKSGVNINSFAVSSTCGNGICEESESENCYDCPQEYTTQYLIDKFQTSSSISMNVNSLSSFPVQSTSFVSSTEILGGERDQVLDVISIPSSVTGNSPFSIAIDNGGWDISVQSGSVSQTTLQYDGFDESASVQTNGLNGKDLTVIGNSFTMSIQSISPSIDCSIEIVVYSSGANKKRVNTIRATLLKAISALGDYIFPYDQFYPYQINFNNINAIEIIISVDDSSNNNPNGVSQMSLKSFGLAGNPNAVYLNPYTIPLLQPTLNPDPYVAFLPPPSNSPPPLLSIPSPGINDPEILNNNYYNGVVGNNNNNNINYYLNSNATIHSDQLVIQPTSDTGNVGIEEVGFVVVDTGTFTVNSINSDASFIVFTITKAVIVDEADVKDSTIQSAVVDVTIKGSTSLSSDLQICLNVNETKVKKSKACLGYIDEKKSPPEWKCEDYCLQSNNGTYCGKTSHLTSFAILFEGFAGEDGYNRCDYILGSSDNDLILTASVAGFVIFLAVIFLFVFCFTPLKRVMYGREGYRIFSLRRQTTKSILAGSNYEDDSTNGSVNDDNSI